MSTTIYGLRPYFDIDGYFINIPGQPTFDPKHPSIYPGAEVQISETLPISEAVERYGKDMDGQMYQVRQGKVCILKETGRTSADIVKAAR